MRFHLKSYFIFVQVTELITAFDLSVGAVVLFMIFNYLSRNPGTYKEVIRLGYGMVVLVLGPVGCI